MTERIQAVDVPEQGPQTESRSVKRRAGDRWALADDVLAVEEPLELRLAHGPQGARQEASISITMRTPGADEQLALGFLFGEGMIRSAAEVISVGPCGPPVPGKSVHNVIRVELDPAVEVDAERLLRHFYTTSSCGVCGKASLDALHQQPRFDRAEQGLSISAENLQAVPERLGSQQATFARTGGLHGAGLLDDRGQVRAVFEDVGRHNALDKLVGASLQAGELPWHDFGVVLSGRASFELLQKVMMAGAPLVAAVGAPSSLAVELADEFGITLIGFLRASGFNVYTHPERVLG